MKNELLKVTWKDDDCENDAEGQGVRYYTVEDWQHCLDHMWSLGSPVLEDIAAHNLIGQESSMFFYYDDSEHFLKSFKVKKVTKRGKDKGWFIDPLRVETYRDDYED